MKFLFTCVFACLLSSAQLHATILIQGATNIEIDTLKSAMSKVKKHQIGSYEFFEGTIKNHKVVISRTLVGLINSAAATALGIELYKPKLIINQGNTGSIISGLKLGEILIAKNIYNAGSYKSKLSHDSVDMRDREPMIAPLGLLDAQGEEVFNSHFSSDEAIINKLAKLLPEAKQVDFASADAFNRQIAWLKHMHELYGAEAEDMESAAAAQVAAAFNTPFLAIRIVANNFIDGLNYQPSMACKLQTKLIKILDELAKIH